MSQLIVVRPRPRPAGTGFGVAMIQGFPGPSVGTRFETNSGVFEQPVTKPQSNEEQEGAGNSSFAGPTSPAPGV